VTAYSQDVAATLPPGAATPVGRLQARERQAWEELYAEFGPRLFRFAFRLTGNGHDAADLVQETFVRALPRLDKLDPEVANVGAYLFTTAKNLFLKQVGRSTRQQPVDEVPEPDAERPIEDEPERLLQLRRQQEEVRLANARLAPRQRLVLALRELEDRTYAEIGDLVGLNENAVAQLISRARDNLRRELRLVQVDNSKLDEACQAFLPNFSLHLDGQLKEPGRTPALEHLAGCLDCQSALAAMEEARRRYRTLLPPLTGGDDLSSASNTTSSDVATGNAPAFHVELGSPSPPEPRSCLQGWGCSSSPAWLTMTAHRARTVARRKPWRGPSPVRLTRLQSQRCTRIPALCTSLPRAGRRRPWRSLHRSLR